MNIEDIPEREAIENSKDEASIIADSDQTRESRRFSNDRPKIRMSSNLEDEPEDFIEGEVDVKTQMDRTERQLFKHLDGGDGDRGRHEDDRVPNP